MFSFLAPYTLFIKLFAGALVLAGIYALFANENKIGYQQCVAEHTTKQLLAEVDARDKEAKLNKQLQDAQHDATIREQENKKLSDALAVTNRKLRDTTTSIRNSLSTNSCETNRNTADAALTVFDECRTEYTKMAENAAGHATDWQELDQGWPKLP